MALACRHAHYPWLAVATRGGHSQVAKERHGRAGNVLAVWATVTGASHLLHANDRRPSNSLATRALHALCAVPVDL